MGLETSKVLLVKKKKKKINKTKKARENIVKEQQNNLRTQATKTSPLLTHECKPPK